MFRSNNNIVIALAKTGKETTNKKVVNKIDQIYKEIRSKVKPILRIPNIVLIKLNLPAKELIPAKCKEKITISTLCLK